MERDDLQLDDDSDSDPPCLGCGADADEYYDGYCSDCYDEDEL